MRFALFLFTTVAALFSLSASASAQGGKYEVWQVQFDNQGIVDLRLLREGGKIVAGFALETDRNVPWFADARDVAVMDDGRLTGKLILTQGPDLVALIAASKGRTPPPAAKPETVTLDLAAKDGKITGTVAVAQKSTHGLLGHNVNSVKARGHVRPVAPALGCQMEFMPLGVASTGAGGLYAVGEAFYLRLHLRGGKAVAGQLIPVFQKAAPVDLALPADQVFVEGNTIKGRIPIKFQPAHLPTFDGVVIIDGTILGDLVAGKARWEGKGQDAGETCFRGRVSRAREVTPLDTSDRTWPPQGKPLQPNSDLAAKAREESLQPIFPGKPGTREFYSTRLIHLKKFYALFPPTIAFDEVPDAVRYRIIVAAAKDSKLGGPWSFETKKPWEPLTPIWKDLPAGPLTVTAVGLAADGKDLGPARLPQTTYRYVGGNPLDEKDTIHWTHPNRAKSVLKDGRKYSEMTSISLTKKASFAGPYWAPNRTPLQTALALARFVRDDLARAQYRGAWSMAGFTGGDGGDAVGVASLARACVMVAKLTDDPVEREEALALAERLAWRVYLTHRGKKPVVYKANVNLMIWIMLAYLDLYQESQDERFREAALDFANVLAADQSQDGAWPKDGAHWPGGVFGPSEFRTSGAEAVLHYLGRVRVELKTNEFVGVEVKAFNWVRNQCLPAMTWQNVGYHSGEMIPLQDTVAPHALSFCTWMLDHADPKAKDVKLVGDIARWCEERHVDWSRIDDPTLTRPSCWGWTRAAGTGVRTAGSLAYVSARLYQETGDPLWKAKAESLIHAIQVSQDPVKGGLPYHFRRSTEDADQTHHTYDTLEAAHCILSAADRLARSQAK